MKKLNVRKTSAEELNKKWGFFPPRPWVGRDLFIRCNRKGNVNWDVAPVYTSEELITRNNVSILNSEGVEI